LFIASWLVAAFTFERAIVVRYPLKREAICTVRRAKMIIGCLTIAALIVQGCVLFTTGIIKTSTLTASGNITSNKTLQSKKKSLYYYEAKRIFNMLETFVTVFIPPVMIVILNSLLIQSLFKFNQSFKVGANKHRSSSPLPAVRHQINIEVGPRFCFNFIIEIKVHLRCIYRPLDENVARQVRGQPTCNLFRKHR